jgi:hypothetical protein
MKFRGLKDFKACFKLNGFEDFKVLTLGRFLIISSSKDFRV